MQVQGCRSQAVRDLLYDASGTITAGGTAQLILPEAKWRSYLLIQNLSQGPLYVEFGSARITCTLKSVVVTGTSIANAGMGFTSVPIILAQGGGNPVNSTDLTGNTEGYPSPSRPASLTAVLTGSPGAATVTSVVINDGGTGYVKAPILKVQNSLLDPWGSAAPSATSGIMLPAFGPPLVFNGTFCPTDPIAVYGDTTGQAFVVKYA